LTTPHGSTIKTTMPVPRKINVLIVNGAKISPSATTVPRSVTKQAARMILPYSAVLNPNSSITA